MIHTISEQELNLFAKTAKLRLHALYIPSSGTHV